METIIQKLTEANVGKVKENELLSKHTTIKIGGPADLFIEPNSIEGLKKTIEILNAFNTPIRVIGRGSNLLIPDEGLRGAVIKFGVGLDHLEENEDHITVGGGYPLVKLATIMSRKGKRGLAFAGGIPGSVGGAVYMNAGAHGSDMSNILVKSLVLFPDGTLEWLTNKEMKFSYRTSVLQEERRGYCVEAVLKLENGDKEEIVEEMKKYKDYRRDTQPWSHPCCGSVFRNPLPNHAGKLVQDAGLKGYQIGGAKISELHGNFIVNEGNATFEDVMALIDHIKKTIVEKYDVKMETEVEILEN
ncbi:UDP-N-acetylmuramate dehydrogenase [Salirhabdus euzebyi]|uniref:UDP-N-acetylenolpyruvoylglucosamine reductase n=1 Tax=Salirhabdus euzebyi TaxID=394506 RepID=A0A841Q963_9BACI|nr:UDP-N-acetylmuramate dehydrogenase [Salirhabdus euzebyi]MBB6455031.1 UDP-N-acetylmuramate dehydrogenase [Salirhabdus euzebyi]